MPLPLPRYATPPPVNTGRIDGVRACERRGTLKETEMPSEVAALVVSPCLENRKALLRILDGLSADVFAVARIAQAREVLEARTIAVIFCEESVSDGTYRDLLAFAAAQQKNIQFIVMLTTGEWPEFLEALNLGAEALRCPLQPTDVELALIHAMRREQKLRVPRISVASA